MIFRDFGDICPLLDVDDMVKMKKPDWKCVFTYVQSFYRRFRNGREKPSPTRALTVSQETGSHSGFDPMAPGVIRIQKHEYLFESNPVVEPFKKFKNFEIKPLPTTSFKAKSVAIL